MWTTWLIAVPIILTALPGHVNCATGEDPYDLSYLQKGASIGDSYAAGIGAGNRIGKFGCFQYDASYSNQVANAMAKNSKFEFLACSGATVEDVRKQATKLSNGQEFVIVSAGGNDVNLESILNACVYRWTLSVMWWVETDCEKALNLARGIIAGPDFKHSVVELIGDVKPKLTAVGKIYYVGYAKFFDVSDNKCDGVSWRVWVNYFTRQYLTLERRQKMNGLVDDLNNVLRDVVRGVGGQIELIDYDEYLDFTGGRFCARGADEDKSRGANRPGLFFYEMKTEDPPVFDAAQSWAQKPPEHELKSRDSADDLPKNGTLEQKISDMIMATIKSGATVAALDMDNVNNDLREEVDEHDGVAKVRRNTADSWPSYGEVVSASSSCKSSQGWFRNTVLGSDVVHSHEQSGSSHRSHRTVMRVATSSFMSEPRWPRSSHSANPPRPKEGEVAKHANYSMSTAKPWRMSHTATLYRPLASGSASPVSPYYANNRSQTDDKAQYILGQIYRFREQTQSDGLVQMKIASANSPGYNTSTSGLVVSNATHVILANNNIVQKSLLLKLFASVKTLRVFHPTQQGHALIANLIMFRMAANRAKALGIKNFPPERSYDFGEKKIEPQNQACNGDQGAAKAGRDPIISALKSFCGSTYNVIAQQGALASGMYNTDTLDRVNISILWDGKGNLAEHSCRRFGRSVTDNCDIPFGNYNTENTKHGGIVQYRSIDANATISVRPLSIRKIWNGGRKLDGQQCTDINTRKYLDAGTLVSSISTYCKALADRRVAREGEEVRVAYNEETPGGVALRTKWPAGEHNFEIFEEECVHYMSAITHGCQVPNLKDGYNRMNWKAGGKMIGNNDIVYSIEPTYQHKEVYNEPFAGCRLDFKLVYLAFEVWGRSFNNVDHGQDKLLGAVRDKCGATTNWKFWYEESPDRYGLEWHATGNVPVTARRPCLEAAIALSGGPEVSCQWPTTW